MTLFGLKADAIETIEVPKLDNHIIFKLNNIIIASAGTVKKNILDKFGIKQPVYFAGLNWAVISELATSQKQGERNSEISGCAKRFGNDCS